MTREDAAIIIGNIPIDKGDDCYTIAEYQQAKAMAIKELNQVGVLDKIKDERKKIAEDVANKMDYIGSCLNEKNIILGIITGKRETTDSLCSICKSEDCVSNGTAISKSDYEARLKANIVAILDKIRKEINQMPSELAEDGQRMIQRESVFRIIDKYKEESEGYK